MATKWDNIAGAQVQLNNGHKMPLLGLGSWNANGADLHTAITLAIASGYRHFDTAQVYGNEPTVGQALAANIAAGHVTRSDLFVTDKLWNTHHRPDLVRDACIQSLQRLGLDYLDMYLMHWPLAFREDPLELWPRDAQTGELVASADATDFVPTWTAMQRLIDEGLVRGIGVCNFNRSQLDRLLEASSFVPACVQIECHPYLSQKELSGYCAKRGIQLVAYSPLGSPGRPNRLTGEPLLFADECVLHVAREHERSAAQVLIRYQLQRGHATIVKSVTAKRIAANADVFGGWELSAEQMGALDALNYGRRFVPFLACVDHKEYPFKVL